MNQPHRTPKLRRPVAKVEPKKSSAPSFDKVLNDLQRVFKLQLNTFLIQFVEGNTDADIEAFLPEDLSEADAWVDEHVSVFTDNEQPTTDDMVTGMAAIFMMAFLELLYEQCGLTGDAETDEEIEGEGEPDGD